MLFYLEGSARRTGREQDERLRRLHSEPDLVSRIGFHLAGPDPRLRSAAADLAADVAGAWPDLAAPLVPGLAAALENEEVPTRLAALRALAAVAAHRPEDLDDDFDTIRLGLFDPLNPEIRSAAAEVVAHFGSGDAVSARRAFPHLAEALRRFHDQEKADELVRWLGHLAGRSRERSLRDDVWRAVRRHEKHPDAAVRARVEEVREICSRPTVNEAGPREAGEEP